LGGIEKGKPIVTSGDLDVKELGFAPKDMSWMHGRKSSILEIANSFGVPESMIALNSSNLASALTATNEYFRHSIFPKMSKFIAKLNEVLVPMYGQPGLFLWYDGFIKPDAVTNSSMVVEQFNAGLIDRREARQFLGLDPDPIQSSQEGSGRVEEDE
jgi:phage portal protein BeeE